MRWAILFLWVIQAWAGEKLLVFLGEKNCPWSEKLEQEVLHNPQFIRGLKNEVALVPMTGHEKYFVEEVPTFILIAASGEEIGRVGYMTLTASDYAQFFQEMIKTHAQIATLDTLDVQELRNLYTTATQHHLSQAGKILEKGVEKDSGTFFLIHRYAHLLKKGSKKAKSVRQEIEERDPENRDDSFFRLAVLDFQKRIEESHPVEKTVKPLKRYLKTFGTDWRAHMLLARFLFGKERVQEALREAKAAESLAPQEAQENIRETITHMEGKIT
jgi:hypothetical protein